MSVVFQALSSINRRRILAYLSDATLTAGEIAERFEMSKPAISKHLSILENAGLVVKEKRGLNVHYTLNEQHLMGSLSEFLADFCPEGRILKIEGAKKVKSRRTRKGRK
ncbi:MAG: metalloregulator ArsR/SmtB family transcription factor [Pseudomonadota bacterium]